MKTMHPLPSKFSGAAFFIQRQHAPLLPDGMPYKLQAQDSSLSGRVGDDTGSFWFDYDPAIPGNTRRLNNFARAIGAQAYFLPQAALQNADAQTMLGFLDPKSKKWDHRSLSPSEQTVLKQHGPQLVQGELLSPQELNDLAIDLSYEALENREAAVLHARSLLAGIQSL